MNESRHSVICSVGIKLNVCFAVFIAVWLNSITYTLIYLKCMFSFYSPQSGWQCVQEPQGLKKMQLSVI